MSGSAPAATAARPSPKRWHRVVTVATWIFAVACIVGDGLLTGPVRSAGIPGIAASVEPTDVADLGLALAIVSLGALVVLRGRARRYGWMLLAMGAVVSVIQAAEGYSLHARYVQPGSNRFAGALAAWVQDLWMIWLLFGVLLLPSLFPAGYAAGRWRRPVHAAAGGWVLLIVLYALAERPLENAFLDVADPPANPIGLLAIPIGAIQVSWLLLMMASIAIAGGSLVTRWRAAGYELRQQLKWVLFALGLTVAVLAANVANTILVEVAGVDFGVEWALWALTSTAWVGVVVALGFGVLRYRLYEVDLVINRTIVYGAMTALVVIGYVCVVVGVSALVPDLVGSGPPLLAAGLVAVAFAPVRGWVQRSVNRVMFGRRDEPYAVLSELGAVLARSGAPDATLQRVAETVAAALKLPGVAIELDRDGRWETRVSVGTIPGGAGGTSDVLALRHQGQVVGRMVVVRRSPAEPLHSDDRRLLENVAHHAAALAHGVRLNLELRRSREELVLAREEERRRLRRELHDGLGPTLASQTFRLDAVIELLDRDPPAAAGLVAALKEQNRELVAYIRRLVYELRPPALDELGLVGALAAHAGQVASYGDLVIDVDTVPDPLGDLPAAVEVAAYHIAREAITNVVRHANASSCTVRLALASSLLTVSVNDDGAGIGDGQHPGVGMSSMRERAEELGGTFTLGGGTTGSGTQVTATLPTAERAAIDDLPPLDTRPPIRMVSQ